jgi:hypothetical protein
MKKFYLLLVPVVTLLSGCFSWQQQKFADDYFGEPGHTFREAMIGAGNDIDHAVGRFATGYAQGYQNYQASHPVIYVEPQHGTATAVTTQWDPQQGLSTSSTFINY